MNREKQRTIESYNKNGQKFADKFTNYPTYQKKIIEFCQTAINDGSSVLDLGCGPGNNASVIMQQKSNCTLVGYDLSETMIKIAQSTVPNCQFEIQDINDLKEEKQYDVVIASFCIVHLNHTETETLISKIANILPTGGSLFLSCMEGKKPGFETTSFSESEIWFNYYERGWLSDKLKKDCFEVISFSTEPYPEKNGIITTDMFFSAKKK